MPGAFAQHRIESETQKRRDCGQEDNTNRHKTSGDCHLHRRNGADFKPPIAQMARLLLRAPLINFNTSQDQSRMAEEQGTEPLANGEDTQPQVGVISQYVKDLSFENPNAPAVYQWQGQPQIDVQFNIGSNQAADDVYEVILKIDVKAVAADQTAFQVELAYAGLFGLRNIPEDQVQPFLLAEAPRILFPFARRVLADTVRDGGFPPLMLEPIDFAQLYLAQAEQAEQLAQPVGAA
jgi:preprotein translocase subunit SecB